MTILNKAFDSLDERFKPVVLNILRELELKGWQPLVAEGRRTPEQQQEKVRAGVSQTLSSYHLTGCAADIVDQRSTWNIPRVHQYWLDLAEAALKHIPTNGLIRLGMLWGEGNLKSDLEKNRLETYKNALKQGKKDVDWFCDVAHVECHF
jgi:hypothetical protein